MTKEEHEHLYPLGAYPEPQWPPTSAAYPCSIQFGPVPVMAPSQEVMDWLFAAYMQGKRDGVYLARRNPEPWKSELNEPMGEGDDG